MEIHERFLREILKTNQSYWVVAKKRDYRDYGQTKRGNDLIFLISLPHEVMPRQVELDDLTMREVEKVLRLEVATNITLNDDYTPFQMGQRLGEFYQGFNVNRLPINEFIKRAWELKSHDLYQYQKLAREMEAEKK